MPAQLTITAAGSERSVDQGTTAADLFEGDRAVLVARVNGEGVHQRDGYYPQYIGGDDPDAALLIAPMVGFPVDEAVFARTVEVVYVRSGKPAAAREEKPRPAPSMRTTRTSGSPAARSRASASVVNIAAVSEFRLSGRCSCRVSTPPSRLTRRSSIPA